MRNMEKQTVKKKAASKKKVAKKAVVKKAAVKKAATKKAASKKSAAKKTVSYQQRYQMIAEAAYHISEKQGFRPGNEMDNWLQAEKEIDGWITEQGLKLVK